MLLGLYRRTLYSPLLPRSLREGCRYRSAVCLNRHAVCASLRRPSWGAPISALSLMERSSTLPPAATRRHVHVWHHLRAGQPCCCPRTWISSSTLGCHRPLTPLLWLVGGGQHHQGPFCHGALALEKMCHLLQLQQSATVPPRLWWCLMEQRDQVPLRWQCLQLQHVELGGHRAMHLLSVPPHLWWRPPSPMRRVLQQGLRPCVHLLSLRPDLPAWRQQTSYGAYSAST